MYTDLQKYIEFCELFCQNSFMVTLDLDFKVVFVGNQYLKVINKTKEQALGYALYEITPIPDLNRKLSKYTFSEAIASKSTKQVFITNLYHPYPESHVLILLFSPILNKNNDVIGVRLDFTHAKIEYFLQILIEINKKVEPNNLPNNENFLTKREHQVAFLLCHCKSISEVTQVINLFSEVDIVTKTVHNIINRYLFEKFDVSSKVQLLEKLYKLGYDKRIPNSLLSNQFIDLTQSLD